MGLHQVLCVGVDVSLTLDCSWESFPPTGVPCSASIRGLLCCLIASCFVLSSYLPSLGDLLFSEEETEGELHWDKEEVEGC